MRALFLLLAACAPLNQATMSERCRDEYNSCLSACPSPPQTSGFGQLAIDTASCTESCNRQQWGCR